MTAHAEFPTGAPDDDQVFDDEGSDSSALTRPYVTVCLVPDALASFCVERQHMSIQRDDEDLAVRHRHPTVDVTAAERRVVRDRMLVSPQLLAGPAVEGPDPTIPTRDIHDTVRDDRG